MTSGLPLPIATSWATAIRRSPLLGRADVPVGTATGKANEQVVDDPALSADSPANEDVGIPGLFVAANSSGK
jgi:hypothetical protein